MAMAPAAAPIIARMPVPAVTVTLLLLLSALLALSTLPSAFVSAATATCASDADCNAHGVCLPTEVCQCNVGWLGALCDSDPTVAPIFVAHLHGLLDQRIVQEWRILPADAASGSSRRLHLRWTVNTDTWFGGVRINQSNGSFECLRTYSLACQPVILTPCLLPCSARLVCFFSFRFWTSAGTA